MTKVLVTGGAGFLGLTLARRLAARGDSVDLLDDFSRGVPDADFAAVAALSNVRRIAADMLDPTALVGIDADYDLIFHLAAIVGVANVEKRPFQVLRNNVLLTTAAMDLAARQRSLRRFVFASTSEVVAGTLEFMDLEVPTPETAPLVLTPLERPRTSYMLSKIYGEALCHHSALPWTAVRPHNVYGPRMGLNHVIPELLQRAWACPAGGELDVYSVDHTRTFCYVDDAVEIMQRAAEAPGAATRVLNVGAEAPEVTIRQVAEAVVKVVGKSLRIVPRPATAGSPPRRCPNMATTTTVTGCKAATSLEEGIRRTYAWYRPNVFERA